MLARRAFRLQTAQRVWRQVSRRGYAAKDAHHGGSTKKGSDLPWMLASVGITVPAATWLWQQGPEKVDHHGPDSAHAERESHGSHDAEQSDEEPLEAGDDGSEQAEGGDAAEQQSGDSGDQSDEPDSGTGKGSKKPSDPATDDRSSPEDAAKERGEIKTQDDGPGASPGTPESEEPTKSGKDVKPKKGTGEQQAGTRERGETPAEKNPKGLESGSSHPYLDDDEKSTKAGGQKETAKAHGTVDPSEPLKGPGGPGKSKDD